MTSVALRLLQISEAEDELKPIVVKLREIRQIETNYTDFIQRKEQAK